MARSRRDPPAAAASGSRPDQPAPDQPAAAASRSRRDQPAVVAAGRSRRDQLAAVAAELFRARGYAAVGVSDIAAAAGLTGPALYRHFPDKQAVLFEVLRGALDELWQATTA